MTGSPQFLTSRQLADSLGVSESSVKRWVDDGTIPADRTAGGHRRIRVAAAIGFLRRQREFNPSLLPFDSPPEIGPVDARAADLFFDLLLKDHAARARSLIAGRYLAGADIPAIADHLIRPAMQRLGELWKHDPHGILVEHRAVDTCVHALTEISAWIPPPPPPLPPAPTSPAAITAAGPGDPYLLPPLLSSMVLREQGIRTHNLGPSTPIETLTLAVSRYQARLVALSISTPPAPTPATPSITSAAWRALEKAVAKQGGRIVVGGRCAASLSSKLPHPLHICESMTQLAAYAKGWLEGSSTTPTKPR